MQNLYFMKLNYKCYCLCHCKWENYVLKKKKKKNFENYKKLGVHLNFPYLMNKNSISK